MQCEGSQVADGRGMEGSRCRGSRTTCGASTLGEPAERGHVSTWVNSLTPLPFIKSQIRESYKFRDLPLFSMFSRVNQLVRHLSRPTVQSFAGTTTPSLSQPSLITSSVMAAAAGTKTQGKSLIHTAACLVIGDEVLGGKVSNRLPLHKHRVSNI